MLVEEERAEVEEEERTLINNPDQENCMYGDILLDVLNEEYLVALNVHKNMSLDANMKL